MNITREFQKIIRNNLFKGQALILYGARQVGKTTILKEIINDYPDKVEYFNCEEGDVQRGLRQDTSTGLKNFLGNKPIIILDEAQKIAEIGSKLKLLVDTFPKMQIIATGSSSFDLSNHVREPLTGRKKEFLLYPISYTELVNYQGLQITRRELEKYLRFGMYPKSLKMDEKESTKYLSELSTDYLYRDIFNFQDVRSPQKIQDLLELLALQIGQEVSYSELATSLGLSIETIQRYIYLLEQAFVIFRLRAFSRNSRKEVTKTRKIYFYDLGIRNSLIKNHNPLKIRSDSGYLWENFCIVEKIKQDSYNQVSANYYFWRTTDQKEIDLIIEKDGNLNTFEFKTSPIKVVKLPKHFKENYGEVDFMTVSQENFEEFLKK